MNVTGSHRLTFESFGVTGEVLSDDQDLFSAVEGVLPPGWRRARAAPSVSFGVLRGGAVTLDGRRVHQEEERRAQPAEPAGAVGHGRKSFVNSEA